MVEPVPYRFALRTAVLVGILGNLAGVLQRVADRLPTWESSAMVCSLIALAALVLLDAAGEYLRRRMADLVPDVDERDGAQTDEFTGLPPVA